MPDENDKPTGIADTNYRDYFGLLRPKEGLPFDESMVIVENEGEAKTRIIVSLKAFLETSYGPEGENPLEMHKPEHSYQLAADVVSDLEAIQRISPDLVGPANITLDEFISLGHDSIERPVIKKGVRARIRGMWPDDLSGNVTLKEGGVIEAGFDTMFTWNLSQFDVSDIELSAVSDPKDLENPGNEFASAVYTWKVIQKFVIKVGENEKGEPLYKPAIEASFEDVAHRVAVTLPNFDFEATLPDGRKALRVHQPYLNEWSTIDEIVIANRDLRGPCGARDFAGFYPTGDAEFREINLGVRRQIEGGILGVPIEDRIAIARKILGFARTQEGFVLHQKAEFEAILKRSVIFNGYEKDGVRYMTPHEKAGELVSYFRGEYTKFDENAEVSAERYRRMEQRYGSADPKKREEELAAKLSDDSEFASLLKEFGYEVTGFEAAETETGKLLNELNST